MKYLYPRLQAPPREREVTIGIVAPKIYPLNCYVIAGVSFATKRLGWNYVVGEDFSYINEQTVDAVVAPHWNWDPGPLRDLEEKGAPTVTVARAFKGLAAVLCDNHGGLRAVVEHLIEQDRRRICYLAGAQTNHNSIERRQIMESLFQEYAPQLDGVYAIQDEDPTLSHDEWLERVLPPLLQGAPEINALICANDLAAITTIDLLLLQGYRIPQDIALVGFDNLAEELGNARYKITTVQYPVYQMGIEAVHYLKKRLQGESQRGEVIRVACKLMRRDTTGWIAREPMDRPATGQDRSGIDSILYSLLSLDETVPQASRQAVLEAFHAEVDKGKGLAPAFDRLLVEAASAGINPLCLHYLYLGIGRELGRWNQHTAKEETLEFFTDTLRWLMRRWLHAYHSYSRDIDWRFQREIDILEGQLSPAQSPTQIFETFGRWYSKRRRHSGLGGEFSALVLFEHTVQRGVDYEGRYLIHWFSEGSEALFSDEREGRLRDFDFLDLCPAWRRSTNTLVFDLQGYSGTFGTLVVDLDCEFAPLTTHLVRYLSMKLQNSLHYELLRNRTVQLEQRSQELQAASEAKTAFLARMSHEIRTPMNGVIGMTELALDSDLQPEQRECLETALNSANSLLDVINDILDLAKIESGRFDLKKEPFSLRDCLDQLMRSFAAPAHAKGVELVCSISPETPDGLIGDSPRLRQVLVNLVGNALKFSRQGDIVIRVSPRTMGAGRTRLGFSVADQGIGIPENKLESIFDSFEQAGVAPANECAGTGLGLAICSQIVTRMGGCIWCESQLGIGSTFHFTADFGVSGKEQSIDYAPLAAGRQALLLVKSPALKDDLVAMLERLEVSAHNFESCSSMLAHLQQLDAQAPVPPLLILDADAMELGNQEMWERILPGPGKTRSLPILLLIPAGLPTQTRKTVTAQLKGSQTLLKPVSQREFIEAVREILGDEPAAYGALAVLPARGSRHDIVAPESMRGKKVLVVEDSEVNRTVATRILSRAGMAVSVAEDGRKALEKLKEEQFDLILMDIQMPGMDGWETTREIRQREQPTNLHTPIIALTADVVGDVEERCLSAQMDGYVSKPIAREELFRKMEELLADALPEDAEQAPSLPDR